MNQWSGEAGEHKDSWEWFSRAVFCSSTHESVIWRSRWTQRFMRMIQSCSVLFQYSWISDLEKQVNTKIHENDSVLQCFVPVLMNQWSGEAGEHKDSWEWFSRAVFCSSTHESVIWRSRRTQRFMRMIQFCSVLFQYSWISDLEKQANTKIHENDSVVQCFVPVLMNQWSGVCQMYSCLFILFCSAGSVHGSCVAGDRRKFSDQVVQIYLLRWWWTDSVLCTGIWTNTDQFT